ncbi:MAG: HNH endonuclease [Deltaproteobacteria bacterium]|nr:HNH endonuclease [Deltaproteobacteria bacterium]
MKNKNTLDHEIHLKALEVASRYLICTGELIEILQTLDARKTFRLYECTSLYRYAVTFLKLSEDVACNLIAIARKSALVPALKNNTDSGAISVSKARTLCAVLTPDNQSRWLDFAKTVSSKALQREVARVNPKAAVADKASYIAWDRLKLEMGVSEECMQKLRRVQDLESQRLKKAATFEDTLSAALDAYLEKFDPVKKAQRSFARKAKMESKSESELTSGVIFNALRLVSPRIKVPHSGPRKPKSAVLKHQLNLRDQARCTHEDGQGDRCESTRWLDTHHIVPVCDGGDNTFENLTTLCRAHHQMEHLKA